MSESTDSLTPDIEYYVQAYATNSEGTKYLLFTAIILTVFVVMANAQPLPPLESSGAPVPIGGGSLIALILSGLFIFLRKKFKKE